MFDPCRADAISRLMRPTLLVLLPLLAGSTSPAEPAAVLTGAAAYGDWRADAPGTMRLIRPGDLPPPGATRSSSNGPQGAPLPAHPALRVPAGFKASLWATGLEAPRQLAVAPNGDVFVAETAAGQIRVIRPDPKTGEAGPPSRFSAELEQPFGMAFGPPGDDPRWLYVATDSAVYRFPYRIGDLVARGQPERIVDLGISDGGHSTRTLAFSVDGQRLYVSVGSQSNVATDLPRLSSTDLARSPLGAAWGDEAGRADLLSFDPDGQERRNVATGLRNCVGLAVQPGSGDPYCAVNERDGLGDDLPPDYVTRVRSGAFYGWPWFYIGDHPDPRLPGARPDLAAEVTLPDVLIQAHSAPLGLVFYRHIPGGSADFPAAYDGQLFMTLHGSWNRAKRTGYKVARVDFTEGKPTGRYEDFVTGFVGSDDRVWGRPVGIAEMNDGSLLVGEDENGTLWRIAPGARP